MSHKKLYHCEARGDGIKSASIGATMKEIWYFKYFPYVSYGDGVLLHGFDEPTNSWLKSNKCNGDFTWTFFTAYLVQILVNDHPTTAENIYGCNTLHVS